MQYILTGIRKEHGELQDDLAKMLNISTAAYRNKEQGKTQFKMDEMFKIADHYNVKIEDIFLPRKYTLRELERQ
ncbi:hypothetical protein LPAF129_03810 [Ligilactobacillus pabuli]|uniref:HTH cro/C1-type domain-containing protein n=1 Tax=Ligilactobacillus pabuli TaxID=2886039 RepID=A0ABQ5JJ03_9LACO|nr:helix-turn-helix transcriptional regulator [Ligilactobacillus pabuli]GKS80696.1 hypothetical protein LPAF129_03810 [Ligilactobacillus pabuli]